MNDPLSSTFRPDRRRILLAGVGLAGGAALWSGGMTGSASAAENENPGWDGSTTENGWPVIGEATPHRIQGAGSLSVPLLAGDVATVLLHVIRRFHYEIAGLENGDVSGYTRHWRFAEDYESNYLSGTAIAIRSGMYPVGVAGGFFPSELLIIRDVLADCEGAVSWGGDKRHAKESHFEIAVKPRDPGLARVAKKITAWGHAQGEGAGAIDPTSSPRRRAARALERRQRAA
ncbi:hypothetical protein AB0952_25745 [Streptomyces caniferus]|uniref:hypothetical protein n=1 Tax=Streptomyces caniferus TaxID=285557 RepID=UPI0033C86930